MPNYITGPIVWFGGKGLLRHHLRSLLPEHHTYVEVFGGGAALLFDKEPSQVEVYNDIDSGLVQFFRVLRNPSEFEEFHRLCLLSLYSREEYEYCKATWRDVEGAERAYRWYVVARQSFSGKFGSSWCHSVNASYRAMAGAVSKWLSVVDSLPRFHERISRVQIEHLDFRKILNRYDRPETFFYLDPPYVPDTRKGGRYDHELSMDDHKELVEMLLCLKGKAILSGYAHTVYAPLEDAGWQKVEIDHTCSSVGRTTASGLMGKGHVSEHQKRKEVFWLSHPVTFQNQLSLQGG